MYLFSFVVQLLSCVQLFATPWTAARQASLSFTISWNLLRLVSVESVMPSNHLILCHLLLPLPSVFSSIRVFSNELALCIRWPKYWSFDFRSVLPILIQGWLSLGWTGLISLLSKGLFPAPQLKSTNSSALSLLYGPTLTFIHDYWKNHSFDYTDLCWQSGVSAF